MATEAELNRKAMAACTVLMPGAVVLKHADKTTAGIPDTSITWYDRTLWLEFKHADPNFKSQGVQELTCKRLERHGRCLYVIFDTPRNSITLLSPKELGDWPGAGVSCIGFDYRWFAEEIRKALLA